MGADTEMVYIIMVIGSLDMVTTTIVAIVTTREDAIEHVEVSMGIIPIETIIKVHTSIEKITENILTKDKGV